MQQPDLFGKALLDHHHGRTVESVIERDDGYIDEHKVSQYFSGFDGFSEPEKKGLSHADGRVLDIGVGAGRVTLHLQDTGFDVVGIDISDGALRVCRERGVRKLLNMSACDLDFDDGSFDTAIAFCNNFGLCGSMEGVKGMMERLHDILAPDGVFIAESVHPTNTDNEDHLRYHVSNIAKGRPPGQVTLRFRHGDLAGEWFDLLMVTPDEMQRLCGETGFEIETTYEGAPMYVYILRSV
jgi:SAM-dependent methyltransferase